METPVVMDERNMAEACCHRVQRNSVTYSMYTMDTNDDQMMNHS